MAFLRSFFRSVRLAGVVAAVVATVVLPALPAHGANFTVTNTDDSGPGSLRQAILDADAADGADTIDFSVTGTITLTSGQLAVTDDLRIDGPGATNLTISGGGAVRVLDVGGEAKLDLVGVTVANASAAEGGGIFNRGTLTVTNSTFAGNSTMFAGGGIFNRGTLTVSGSTFSGNSGRGGGGIRSEGTLTVTDSTFSENTGGSTGTGGGIDTAGGSLTVTNSTFAGNSAGFAGGGIFSAGTNSITGSTFAGNSAESGFGGGVKHASGTLSVTNSTFSGNSAVGGGGIENDDATLMITNSTFSGNSASDGGGLRNRSVHLVSTLTLQNTVVTNSPSGGNCSGVITDGGGNLSWPDTTCPGITADPLLDPAGLQNNGGPTETIALQPGSPAVDAAIAANCPATDQRGVSRPQGAGCDIGAFELEAGPGIRSFTVNSTAQIAPKGAVRTSGSIICTPAGDRFAINVTLSQEATGAVGTGSVKGTCSGGVDAWTALVRAQSGPRFAPGPATLCFVATTLRGKATVTDREEGCVDVALTA